MLNYWHQDKPMSHRMNPACCANLSLPLLLSARG